MFFVTGGATVSTKSPSSEEQGSSSDINPEELKKRTEFLRAQRLFPFCSLLFNFYPIHVVSLTFSLADGIP